MSNNKKISRVLHALVILGSLLALAATLVPERLIAQATAAAQQKVPPSSGWADTVLVNGKIATMNEAQKFVEALAIRGSRIQAVGTTAQMQSYAGPQTKVIDMKGKTVVPGLITPHDHPHLWLSEMHNTGAKLNPQWDRVGAIGKTPEEALETIQRTIRQLVQQRKPGEWISIRADEKGEKAILDKMLTEKDLDKLAPNNPVIVATENIDTAPSKYGKKLTSNEAVRRAYEGYGTPLRSAMRIAIMNTKARETFQKDGVDVERLNPTRLTVAVMLTSVPKQVGPVVYGEAIRQEMQYWADTQGVTTMVSTWFRTPPVITTFSLLDREKKLPIRMGWYNDVSAIDFGSLQGTGDDYFWNVGTEYEGIVLEEMIVFEKAPELWGTELGYATTYASNLPLQDPRLEKVRADFVPEALHALPGMPGREEIMAWLRQELRVGDVHCYSDGAIDMFIGIIKQLQKETGWSDEKIRAMRNFYLTHNALTRPDQIPEMARYGMTVGPSWRTIFDLARLEKAYGPESKKYMWPVKSLLAAGVRVAPNMDMSPTIGPEGEGMWDILEFLVDREYGGEVFNKDEAVDRWTALKTATVMAAEVALRESEIGSLEVGKLADLAVLDKDYFTVPVKEIGSISPVLTMVGGKVIYQENGSL